LTAALPQRVGRSSRRGKSALSRTGRFFSRLNVREALSYTRVSRISWAGSLRVLIVATLVAVLLQAGILTLVSIVAQSDRWDLPNGALLQTVLSSCQIERSARGRVENEQIICPTRLADHAFPRALRDAVIASEDERFFWHGALDLRSTLRAAWQSLWGDRQGGSTITQQLARSLLLKKEDSFERKLLEAVLAVRISAILTREEILIRYMNAVPHARNMSGFDDPARYYFGVGVEDLTVAEAALLVGMLPEPNSRDPLKNPAGAFEAASGVVRRMQVQKKIDEQQAAEAREELERRVLAGRLRRSDKVYARLEYRPYRDLALREAKANGIALPQEHRLILFVDPEFQQRLIGQICSVTGRHQAAGFFMRPSGEVLALAGSCTYSGQWNRATDIKRSIGSTGKLFPLIGVHELSVSLKQRVSTRPVRRPNWPAESNSRCLKQKAVSLDFALEHSCNRPWTEIAMRLGQRLDEIVKRFGLSPAGSPALVPLGSLHTSPMKLTQVYATLQNRGTVPQVRFLGAAIGSRGNVVGIPAAREPRRAMTPATAAAVLQDLRGPVKRGTARAASSVHALVYGKTGTSSRNIDALFVGLTQEFVGSVWLGFDRPAPMPGVHGGGSPAKAFANLTNFFYVRRAQQRFVARQGSPKGPWGEWEKLAPGEHTIAKLTILGSMLTSCLLLTALWRRRKQPAVFGPTPDVSEHSAAPVPSPEMPLFPPAEGIADAAKESELAGPWLRQPAPS
jgi:penicillin-binding protein 1A